MAYSFLGKSVKCSSQVQQPCCCRESLSRHSHPESDRQSKSLRSQPSVLANRFLLFAAEPRRAAVEEGRNLKTSVRPPYCP